MNNDEVSWWFPDMEHVITVQDLAIVMVADLATSAVRLLLEETTHKSDTLKEISLPQRESDRWNLFIFTFLIYNYSKLVKRM